MMFLLPFIYSYILLCMYVPIVSDTIIFLLKGINVKCISAVDECASGTDECAKDATCIDTTESYVCQCKKGYSGNGKVCQGKWRL